MAIIAKLGVSRISLQTKTFKKNFEILIKHANGKTRAAIESYFGVKSDQVKTWNSITELEWAPDTRWPILIFSTPGRIGNCLTVIGTALVLRHLYPNVTVGVDEIVYQKVANILDEETLSKISLFSYTDIFTIKAEIKYLRKHIHLKDRLVEKAQKYLLTIKKKFYGGQNVTYIGFHVRRGDYVNFQKHYFGSDLPGKEFYKKVLLFYRRKFETPVFIVCSQDTAHLLESFGAERNVHITESFSPEDDFAILASCNNSAMTVGSFGFWASFLTGGTVLYARINNSQRPSFTDGVVGLPGFIPIDTT